MIKKIIAINLVILLSINSFGYSFIENEYNLFTDGSSLDFKAAELAHVKLNGGCYNKDLCVVIPTDVSETEKEWRKAKDLIAFVIGTLPNLSEKNHPFGKMTPRYR